MTIDLNYNMKRGGDRGGNRGGNRGGRSNRSKKLFDISTIIEYPYTHLYTNEEVLYNTYEKLKVEDLIPINSSDNSLGQLKLDKYPDRMLLHERFITGNEYEKLVDYFQEPVRSRCNRRGNPSPYAMFKDPKRSWSWSKRFVRRAEGWKLLPPTPDEYKELAIAMRATIRHDCDLMAAGFIKTILNRMAPRSILMPMGGWGDAIIAACAYGVETLVAVDPHEAAVDNWTAMIDFYKPNTQCVFIKSPFETAVLPDITYDMIYASPPYFIAEEYGNDAGQSYLTNPQLDDWINNFLIFSFDKAWQRLNVGGYMAIALNDIWFDGELLHFTERFHDWVETLPDAQYVYTYGFKKYNEQKNYQPLFVWQKV